MSTFKNTGFKCEVCDIDIYNGVCEICSGKILNMHSEEYNRQIQDLVKKNNKLKEQNKQLQNQIIELKYRPGGPGYYETKDDFKNITVKK